MANPRSIEEPFGMNRQEIVRTSERGSGRSIGTTTMLVVLGSLLLWASAKISVPFYPVPMTMQSAVVLLLGAAYGPRLAFFTVALYLAEGAVGLPVFTGTPERGIGLAYMAGPTGGYLAGYLLAAPLVGLVATRTRQPLPIGGIMLSGAALILGCGTLWLSMLIGTDRAIAGGLLPFVLGDLTKVALATVLTLALVRRS